MKRKSIFLSLGLLVTSLISLLTIAPSPMNYNGEDYNCKNALIDLQKITKEEHSVFDYEAHEEVRLYLKDRLGELIGDENVVEKNYLTASNKNPTKGIKYESVNPSTYDIDADYDIRNITGCLKGKSDKGILLVAHYDSRGNIKRNGELAMSKGAGDDGYGVVTILEMLRYIKDKNIQMENSIYVLFADAEETGMYGSKLYAEELRANPSHPIKFVINIESRGMDGASYMFETSKNNKKVIDLYNASSSQVSYSIAPAVYSIMTNFTDFTNFLEIGLPGLNFTTLNDIEDYHVPSDKYENVNPASLQHYGEHILPILLEFISDSKYVGDNYFDAKMDAVFFNIFPGVFISYSEVIAYIIAILALIGFVAVIALEIKNKEFKVKAFFKHFGISFLVGIVSVVIGLIISLYVARLNGYPWSLTNVRFEGANGVMFVSMIIYALLSICTMKKIAKDEMKVFLKASTALNTLLFILSTFALSGASFVFLLPTFAGIIYLYIDRFYNKKIVKDIYVYVSLIFFILLFVPLMQSLLFALTIGGLLAFNLLTFIPFTVYIPLINEYLD